MGKPLKKTKEDYEKELHNVGVQLDDLLLTLIVLTQEYIDISNVQEQHTKKGYLFLAKARYHNGVNSLNIKDITEHSSIKDICDSTDTKTSIASQMIVGKLEELSMDDVDSPLTVYHRELSSQESLKRWSSPIGGLSQTSLKEAKKHFSSALEITVQRANVYAKTKAVSDKITELKNRKSHIYSEMENNVVG